MVFLFKIAPSRSSERAARVGSMTFPPVGRRESKVRGHAKTVCVGKKCRSLDATVTTSTLMAPKGFVICREWRIVPLFDARARKLLTFFVAVDGTREYGFTLLPASMTSDQREH
jgi:hypothetical protein